MQEQQLKARQLVLQQQAASAVAAASKTQREVCGTLFTLVLCQVSWPELSSRLGPNPVILFASLCGMLQSPC